MGLTDEGLPYAGFTVAKEDATMPEEGFRVEPIYAAMTTEEEYIPRDDDTWYHLAATYEVDAAHWGDSHLYQRRGGVQARKRRGYSAYQPERSGRHYDRLSLSRRMARECKTL